MKAILITSSILILAMAVFRRVLRGRFRPQVQYALWLVLAVRLLVPLEMAPSAFSALALLDRAEEPARVVQAIGQTTVPLPAMSYEDAFDQALYELQQEQTAATSFTDLDQVEHRARELQAKQPTLAQLAAKYARPVWLGGTALMAAWFLLVNFQLRRKLRRALPVEAADCPLQVYVTPELSSPCLCGVFRPAVYVTPAALTDPDRLRHVLAHELTHYRHKDHWWALVRCACLCVYWFDPLVWWAAAMSRQDCELACDAGAIRRLGEQERLSYGRTLVGMIAEGRTPLLQTATTMTGSKRRVKERVELIARRPKTAIALTLAAALLMGLVVGCTFTGAPKEPSDLSAGDPAPLSSDDPYAALSLQERLLNVPEELRSTVKASASETKLAVNNIAVVSYWWDVPAEWENVQDSWLLDVHREERAGIDANGWRAAGDGQAREIIAQDAEYYYTIERPVDARFQEEDSQYFSAAFQAIRAYAVDQVLGTRGVEPYPSQPLETLPSRLQSVPDELRGEVALFQPDTLQTGGSDILVTYALDNTDPEWGNRLLTVRQLSQEGFEYWLHGIGAGYTDVFARDSEHYYALSYPSDVQYKDEDAGRYAAASKAIGDYAKKTVLETKGVEPFQLEETPAQAIKAITDQLLAAPSVELSLAPAGSSRIYAYPIDPGQYPNSLYLSALASNFRWEAAPWSASEGADTLCVSALDGSASLTLKDGSYLVTDGDGNCWKGVYNVEDFVAAQDTTPYEYLRRQLFDVVELYHLRSTTVPNREQSHEEIVREWTENWEGAMTKTAPGSQYAYTYVRIENIRVNQPEFVDRPDLNMTAQEALEEFVKNRNFSVSAEDFGKIWFGFSYDTVFVPVDQSEDGPLWAGNTRYYEGDDAPEGALVYSHVGYLFLTDEGWTCTGVGTGW